MIHNSNTIHAPLSTSVRVWNFKNGGSQKASLLAKNQGIIFKKFLRVMTVRQKMPKLYFQSQFWMSETNQIFSKKNRLRISI